MNANPATATRSFKLKQIEYPISRCLVTHTISVSAGWGCLAPDPDGLNRVLVGLIDQLPGQMPPNLDALFAFVSENQLDLGAGEKIGRERLEASIAYGRVAVQSRNSLPVDLCTPTRVAAHEP